MNTWQNILYIVLSSIGFLVSIRFFFFVLMGTYQKNTDKRILYSSLHDQLFFSILIPAKEEASVITNTLKNMLQIQYSRNKQEIILITDQKETIAHKNESTRKVVERWIEKNCNPTNSGKDKNQSFFEGDSFPSIYILDVPITYDGTIPGSYKNQFIPSSKGRALNYALSVHSFSHPYHYCSFFDAETHAEESIFSYIQEHTSKKEPLPVWQGPALQVRNFKHLSLFSKIAALAQAFSHDYTLPSLLRWIPFLGGTNMHIPYSMIQDLHGFQATCATEDIEMGIRIWDQWNTIPKFLPIVCTEQTPANFRGYFVQRYRWGKGIIDVLLHANKSFFHTPKERSWMLWKVFLLGPIEWYLYGILSIFYLSHTLQKISVPISSFDVSYFLFLGTSIVFIQSLYLRYRRYMQYNKWSVCELFQFFLLTLYMVTVLPFFSFLYGLPFICGSLLSVYQKLQNKPYSAKREFWEKTPRTSEK
ncbi:MAG: glycosyltransferase family 2 protein [Caldisericia bacterium]|nr:glycosyltransferase family 2 protein [Caldisericia bacterium]